MEGGRVRLGGECTEYKNTALQDGPAPTSTSSEWEDDSPDIWPMETEVGGPSRCEAQVLELWGGCYPASAKRDTGKEVGCADLSLASSRAWPW